MGCSPTQCRWDVRTRLCTAALTAVALLAAVIAIAIALAPRGSASGMNAASSSQTGAVSSAGVRVGPGPVVGLLVAHGYKVTLRLAPNRASRPDTVSIDMLKGGRPVDGAHVKVTFRMIDMDMGQLSGLLPERAPGHYTRPAPVLGMSGRWALRLDISPPGSAPFSLALTDQMGA